MTHLQSNQDTDELFTDNDCPPTCTHNEPCDNCKDGLEAVQHMNDIWETEELLYEIWEVLKEQASIRGLDVFDRNGYSFRNFMEHAYRHSSTLHKAYIPETEDVPIPESVNR